MEKKENYIIPLRELPLGMSEYSYQLEDSFFEEIDAPEVKRGKVNVEVSLKKGTHSFELDFHSVGYVFVPCDRCLEDMEQSIETDNHLVVKFGDEYEEVDDTLVIIPEIPGELDLSWFMYEFIALNIPIRHIHPVGECSEAMVSQLKNYIRTQADEMEEDEDEEDPLFSEEPEEKATDPRWEKLKSLLNK